MSAPIDFLAPGGGLAVRLEAGASAELHRLASARHPYETGGTLVGYYDGDALAVVTGALGPPPDSVHGPTTLDLGVAGLDEHFAALWPDRYYLGTWHTHPGERRPVASDTDHATMRIIANSPQENCPEPIAVILGGTPGDYATIVTVYDHGAPVLLAQEARS